MTRTTELGPLQDLAGTWEGGEGLDVAFANASGRMEETPFRERTTFSPFGPVRNGAQVLYGLDYRTAAWQPGHEEPFHTEVGYWLWDAAASEVLRGFVVPRGIVVLAVGAVTPHARTFTLQAQAGSETAGICSNHFLAVAARTVRFEVTVTVAEDGRSFSYDATSTIEHHRVPGAVFHTDRNTLHRVG